MSDAMHEIDLACAAIRHGEIVGVPTDTVYGLAIDPLRRSAHELLFAAKRREPAKAVPILVADELQAADIAVVNRLARRLIEQHWPGGLTIVLHRRRGVPVHVGDPVTGTVAVRAPNHPVALALLERCGPLAVTSANRSGEPPAGSADDAAQALGSVVAVYLDGPDAGGVPSTVVDATGDDVLVLRPGAVDIGAT